ncbi:sugar ABC transporter substrate-binding protein [Saccharicrinis aurantiacus]|uniref:sugar ABC transporter substrate-binding protein n=1 Tax=Saccharicrinis aurantiacus TaxID=1849719 RepID=UPI0024924C63|nr:substrate-binding domain-containing protein [Saccharicrinis aurantiacus]
MKSLSQILMLSLSIFLLSCEMKPTIGFLVANLEQERWQKDIDNFKANVEDLGGIAIVAVADSDEKVQYEQALKMIADGVDVLVVVPVNRTKACEIVKTAHKNSIPVISYDRLIKDCNLDYYISTDNIGIGELQANYLTKIKPSGKYGIIGGATTDNNAYLLKLGQMNVLQPLIDNGSIEIIFDSYTKHWSIHEGYEMTNKYLQESEDIDAIIAGNDDLASGAISALKEHNLEGKVLVAGQDADIEAIKNIVIGNQTITIYKPIESLSYAAADAAIKISKGIAPSNGSVTVNNGKRLVPAILLQAQIVNKQNIEMTVISEGFIKKEEIKKR